MTKNTHYRFSFGPWNIHAGADSFGPPSREEFSFIEKLRMYRKLGFEGIQLHDDDVVEDGLPYDTMKKKVMEVKKLISDEGLEAEFIAPRLWEDPRTVDGAITANDVKNRVYALERSKRSIDIAKMLDTNRLVLWPAREGTYIREAKCPIQSVDRFVEYLNQLLEYDPDIRIMGEMKPNEPMDHAYLPTPGHFIGVAYRTVDPSRVGVLIESAHCTLAGLDPAEEMGYALSCGKLWGVHLNDQNGMKFDEDKTFGSVDLRRAFNQVRVLEDGGYGRNGEFVGLDVKAMRTQPKEISWRHLENSRRNFEFLLDLVRSYDKEAVQGFIDQCDYESLDDYIFGLLVGRSR